MDISYISEGVACATDKSWRLTSPARVTCTQSIVLRRVSLSIGYRQALFYRTHDTPTPQQHCGLLYFSEFQFEFRAARGAAM